MPAKCYCIDICISIASNTNRKHVEWIIFPAIFTVVGWSEWAPDSLLVFVGRANDIYDVK